MNYDNEKFTSMTDINLIHIKESFNKKRKPLLTLVMIRWMPVIVCLAMIFIVGFAFRDEVLNAFRSAFQNKGDYISQYGEIIEGECYSNGIRMKLLSAVNDGENYIFMTLTDEKEDRLSDDMKLIPIDSDLILNYTQLDYDPNTKTATFIVLTAAMEPSEIINFAFLEINSDRERFNTKDMEGMELDILLGDHIPETYDLSDLEIKYSRLPAQAKKYNYSREDFRKGLLPGQRGIRFGDIDNLWIYNIGFIDDFFHIQFRTNDNNQIDVHTFSLIDKSTGERVKHLIDFEPFFVRNHYNLREFGFQIDPNNLNNYIVSVMGSEYKTKIQGYWDVAFKTGPRIKQYHLQDAKIINKNGEENTLTDIILTPLSLSFRSENPDLDADVDWDTIFLEFKDGTIEEYICNFASQGEDGTKLYSVATVIEDVSYLIINGCRLPVDISSAEDVYIDQ